jgi:hypothetical protein
MKPYGSTHPSNEETVTMDEEKTEQMKRQFESPEERRKKELLL